jgi:sarcosine oxidase subunit alpha
MQPLYDGLIATSQNHWPSLRLDLWRANDYLSPIFPAGFYNKTFMRPAGAWRIYEKVIRRAAGLGTAPQESDPDTYGHRYTHCDVLVVGAGPAGLAAAVAAAQAGVDVMLVDEREEPGGSLYLDRRVINGRATREWVAEQIGGLSSERGVRVMPRTTAFGFYDHGWVALLERVVDRHGDNTAQVPRQRRWLVKASRVVLATGAIERPLVFAGNDLPGVMLASAARRYINQYGVAPGRRAVVFTNNVDGYRTVFDLLEAGVEIAAVVDARTQVEASFRERLEKEGLRVLSRHAVAAAAGGRELRRVEIREIDEDGNALAGSKIFCECDLLCMSGGYSPSLHLHSQAGGKIEYDAELTAFVPGSTRQAVATAGAAAGAFGLAECIRQGAASGTAAAGERIRRTAVDAPAVCDDEPPWSIRPLWLVTGGAGKRFVDFQDDVTVADLALATRENYSSIEHVKRYTTLGMGTDQGKTSNLNGLAIVASISGRSIPAVGTTTYRPPYTPVALGALAGLDVGENLDPVRRSPLHEWHDRAGAVWIQAGLWMRPRAYPKAGETFEEAWRREVLTVRRSVGLCDVSTLGKIDVQGPDAEDFLARVYCNAVEKVAIGRCRYGLMLREDGVLLDDGTVARLDSQRFYITTTTSNATKVMSHLEFLAQAVWPRMRVQLASVTEQFAQIALSGPRSKQVLSRMLKQEFDDATLPHLGVLSATVLGVGVNVFRLSFCGELSYEISVPADHAETIWKQLLQLGAEDGIEPYGLEALGSMRIEKGHVAQPELDGRCTPGDLGLQRLVSRQKSFVGRWLLDRPQMSGAARKSLAGLTSVDSKTPIRSGAQLVPDGSLRPPLSTVGHVTSATNSPTLGYPIALAMLEGGIGQLGRRLIAVSPLSGEAVAVTVVAPQFYDPDGRRLRA